MATLLNHLPSSYNPSSSLAISHNLKPAGHAAFAPSVLIGVFPLSLIPVFAVPLSILLHLTSLQKLRQERPADYKDLGTGEIRIVA